MILPGITRGFEHRDAVRRCSYSRGGPGRRSRMTAMANQVKRGPTAAFYVQAALAFGISVSAVSIGIAYLPMGGWPRAFLAIGLIFVVTSTFTLAKCVRD